MSELVPKARGSRGRSAIEGAAIAVGIWLVLFTLRVLPDPLMTTAVSAIVAALGAATGALGHGRVLTVIFVAVIAVFGLVVLTPIAVPLARDRVRDDRPAGGSVDAVVALSASVKSDTTLDAAATDRLLTALEHIRGGTSRTLVTTTVVVDFPSGPISSVPDQQRLVRLFAPDIDWINAGVAASTRGEALRVRAALAPRNVRRIAVVTSPMHTRRACRTFEKVGFQVTCIPARASGTPGRRPDRRPAGRIAVFGAWVYETAATILYRSRGWL